MRRKQQLIKGRRVNDRSGQARALAKIEQIVASVAHEINNPLTAIKMNAELLLIMLERHCINEICSDAQAQYKRQALAIMRGIKRIEDITSDLKFFTQRPREKTAVALAQCVEEAWNVVSSNKDIAENVVIKLMIRADIIIYANAQQLEQVFINLLHNALKAIQSVVPKLRQGIIHVSAWCEAEWGVITITDNGCGISKSSLPNIFEPFYTSDERKGTGLGLAIVQRIVTEHDGNVGVISTREHGTTFTIKLPLIRLQGEG